MALVKVKKRSTQNKQLGRVIVKNEPAKKHAILKGVTPATLLETPKAFRRDGRVRNTQSVVRPTTRPNMPSALATQQKRKARPARHHRVQAEQQIDRAASEAQKRGKNEARRFKSERQEMRETHDLSQVDDDVETEAVLFEWTAPEHSYNPRSSSWFIVLAVGTTAFVGLLGFLGNILGAILVAFIGGTIYYIAQHKPGVVRYRIMVDGVAVNNRLYPYQELAAFNIKYEPGEVKTVMLRSQKRLAPMINLEIGDADPVAIRDRLLEFLQEDLDMEEPLADSWARRIGF